MSTEQNEFEEKLVREQVAGFKARTEDEPPPGMLPDGTLNVVEPGSPRQKMFRARVSVRGLAAFCGNGPVQK